MIYRTVTVEPEIIGSVIQAQAELVDGIISVEPEFITKVRTYGGETQPYTGEYEFTPGEDTQTIEIQDKTATRNIVINPIPSNYGLITWNGRTLIVS